MDGGFHGFSYSHLKAGGGLSGVLKYHPDDMESGCNQSALESAFS